MAEKEFEQEACQCHCDENGCGCGENCDCGSQCHCHEGERCNQDCTCENTCKCDEECDCEGNCDCDDECCCHEQTEVLDDKAQMYLGLARQIQADFDNYRRHAVEDKNKARVIGQISIIEAFLPAIDTFKDAKKTITDENVLKGVEMIENKILEALEKVGVKKMETIGQKFDHNYHEAIAQYRNDEKEDDQILDEYQAGYTFNDKVLRYAKVIVNKKEN